MCATVNRQAGRSLQLVHLLIISRNIKTYIFAQHGLEIPIILGVSLCQYYQSLTALHYLLLYIYFFKYPYFLSLKESLMCHFLTLSRQECCCDIWLKIEIGKSPTLWILLRIFHPPAHLANKRTIFPAKIHFVIYHTENVLIERFLGPFLIIWRKI